MPEPRTPKPLASILDEVLTKPIPYKTDAEIPLNDSFYLVCSYPMLPKGTVLFCLRQGESKVQVQGFLPDTTDTERAALGDLLQRHTSGKTSLSLADLERAQLRVCTEEQGIQRLLDVQREIAEHNKNAPTTRFH